MKRHITTIAIIFLMNGSSICMEDVYDNVISLKSLYNSSILPEDISTDISFFLNQEYFAPNKIPIEESQLTLSSASESTSESEEEKNKNDYKTNSVMVDYKGQKEPIEAFYRRNCPECSTLIYDPHRVMPSYKKHWQLKHPGKKIQYGSKQEPNPQIFYTLEARCPLYGKYIKSNKHQGPCHYIYSKDAGTLEIESRIAEFCESHYKRVHKIKISKENLSNILQIKRTRCNFLNSSYNKKKRKQPY